MTSYWSRTKRFVGNMDMVAPVYTCDDIQSYNDRRNAVMNTVFIRLNALAFILFKPHVHVGRLFEGCVYSREAFIYLNQDLTNDVTSRLEIILPFHHIINVNCSS